MAAGNYHQPSWWFGIPPSVPRFRQPTNVGSQPRVVLGVSNGRTHPLLPTGENLSGRTSTKQKKCTVKLPIESDRGHGTKECTGHIKQTKSLWSRTPTSHSHLPRKAFIRGQLEVITAELHPEHIQGQGKASIIPVSLPSTLQWDLMRQGGYYKKTSETRYRDGGRFECLQSYVKSRTRKRPANTQSLPVVHPYHCVFSLQIQADPGIKAYDFEPIVRDIMGCSDRSPSIPGASDSNPIFLPNVKIVEFVHLLELVLGRPYDKRYIKITTAAQSPKINRPKYGARIMDAGVLATRFGMDQLDSWAQSQILQLLKLSPASRQQGWGDNEICAIHSRYSHPNIPARISLD